MKKRTFIVNKDSEEYHANIYFASDSKMSPSGVDEMSCENKVTGEKWVEVCTKLTGNQEGQFKIEIK